MRSLLWLILIFVLAWGASVAEASGLAPLPSPLINLESSDLNFSFEKRDEGWIYTSQSRLTKSVLSRKISESSEVTKANLAYNDARDWARETFKTLRPVASCADIKIRFKGAVPLAKDLCSRVAGHRAVALHLHRRLVNVAR